MNPISFSSGLEGDFRKLNLAKEVISYFHQTAISNVFFNLVAEVKKLWLPSNIV